jgi:hypothetical protein
MLRGQDFWYPEIPAVLLRGGKIAVLYKLFFVRLRICPAHPVRMAGLFVMGLLWFMEGL